MKNIRRPDPTSQIALFRAQALACNLFVVMVALIAFGLMVGGWGELSDPHSGNFVSVLLALLVTLVCGAGAIVVRGDVLEKLDLARRDLAQQELSFQLREQQLRDDSRAA